MMKERKSIYQFYISVVTLLLVLTLSISSEVEAAKEEESNVINEDYANKLSLQPVAPAFDVASLLKWSPEKDPDAKLNRASVALNKDRFKGHQINPLANPKAGITSAAITTLDHDLSSSVGSNEFNVYAFDNWQLLDSYIYWPGSPNKEGFFALPSPDIVDAAHRNGVPVYATIGFPWGGGSPEVIAEIEAFTQQSEDGSFPVADKMIEAADYYGFDGYFLNQETSGVSKKMAERMNEMMRYAKRKSNIRFSWYDAQANNGSISYQNAVNENNDMYIKKAEDGAYAVDEFFLNYNWGVSEIDTTVSTMKKHGHTPYNAYAGFELQQNSYNTRVNTDALLNKEGQSKVSIALYTPNSTMGLANNPADFHEEEKHLWTGPQGDPSIADDSSDWKGMARFITDSSVIQNKPFASSFNSGHGKKYYVNGEVASSQEWNNRSIQDIMPTWRWWIRNKGSRINAEYDFEKAFNGGNSLKFIGNLDANSENEIMLYSTKLPIEENTKVRLVYNNKPGANISLGVAYGDDYAKEDMAYYPLPDSKGHWKSTVVDLGEDEGKTAYALSLMVRNPNEIKDYSFNLGHVSIYDEQATPITKLENVKIEEKMLKTADKAEARLSWTPKKDVLYYEVYQKNAGVDKELLGVTPNSHFYTPNITRTVDNTSVDNVTSIEVIPVNRNYLRGESTKIAFDWGMNIDATEKEQEPPSPNVALNANVTDVSSENVAEPASKALDGSSSSKWAATNKSNGYLAIDIGEQKTIKRWRVEHAEAGGETSDMNTVDFELLYKDKEGNWVSAKRITDNHDAITDIILDEPITANEFKLQIHDSGSSPWGAIRVYEWQLSESDKLPKTENIMMHFVTAENNKDATDKVVIENVKKGQIVRLYNSLKADEVLAEKSAEKDGTVSLEALNFGKEAGKIYYTVERPELNESLRYSVGYLSEDMGVADLKLSVHLSDLKGQFLDSNALNALKMHLTAVEHYANSEKTDKVIKHLTSFKTLLHYQNKNELVTEAAFEFLLTNTDKVIEQYK